MLTNNSNATNGNRLSETTIGNVTLNYVYDNANRLSSVEGVSYTWDDNGNLLSDGVSTYTYNHSNQLTGVSQGGTQFTFDYNGLGDRLRQTVGASTTNYVIDNSSGLSQVLADGTNTYLYGLDRISQSNPGGKDYFLGDALGSVRQLANTSGGITLSRSYEPYGTTYGAMGSKSTSYGYTSEWTDGTGLVNLRARYYAPAPGRFISQDRWRGNINNPLTLNRWLYANGNPIKFTDPSGMISYDESKDAEIIINTLLQYGVTVVQDWGLIPTPVPTPGHSEKGCNNWDSGRWSLMDLKILDYSIFQLSNQLKGVEGFKKSIGSVKISKQFYTCGRGCTYNLGFYRKIELLDTGRPAKDAPLEHYIRNASFDFDAWTVVHELAHAWDFNYSKKLSIGIESFTSGHTDKSNNYPTGCKSYEPGCNDAGYYYGGIPPKGSDAGFTREEDFAESVAAYVFPNQAQQAVSNYRGKVSERYLYYEDFTKTLRYSYINGLIYK